jgi:hypothetical protein
VAADSIRPASSTHPEFGDGTTDFTDCTDFGWLVDGGDFIQWLAVDPFLSSLKSVKSVKSVVLPFPV